MPTLRLFANLREAAGSSSVEIPGATVGEVLESATARFGARFAAGLETARVWVNGEPADGETPVEDGDEIALIPPVSGGATATRPTIRTDTTVLPFLLVTTVLVAGWIPLRWFALVAVGTVIAWAWDLTDTGRRIAVGAAVYPALLAAVSGAVATYAWGFPGLAGGLALGVAAAAAWPVFDARTRAPQAVAATVTVAFVAATGAGGLVLLRMMGTPVVVAYVAIAVVGMAAATVAQATGGKVQSFDPNVGALLGSLLSGVAVGLVAADIELAAAMLGAVATAAGLIAGRAFGSMLRSGAVLHTAASPGVLAAIDGFVIAAPLFWLTLWVFG